MMCTPTFSVKGLALSDLQFYRATVEAVKDGKSIELEVEGEYFGPNIPLHIDSYSCAESAEVAIELALQARALIKSEINDILQSQDS